MWLLQYFCGWSWLMKITRFSESSMAWPDVVASSSSANAKLEEENGEMINIGWAMMNVALIQEREKKQIWRGFQFTMKMWAVEHNKQSEIELNNSIKWVKGFTVDRPFEFHCVSHVNVTLMALKFISHVWVLIINFNVSASVDGH